MFHLSIMMGYLTPSPKSAFLWGCTSKKNLVIHSSPREQKGHGPPKYELRRCNVIPSFRHALSRSTACVLKEDSLF